MNKKIIIFIIVAILVAIGAIVLVKNTNTNGINTNVLENKEKQESEIKTGEFSFIYNYNELLEEWWDSPNSEWLEFTNRDAFEIRAEENLGNISGKLQVRPVDFTEYLKIGYESITIKDEYYSLEAKNNTFLIPQQIKVLDDDINSELKFYVLGTDLYTYEIKLMVDKNPKNVELNNNNWKIVSEESKGSLYYNAYYPINTDYCLHLEFPYVVLEQTLKELDENTREYYKTNCPYNEKDLEELVNKTVEVFSLNKLQGTTIDKLSFNVELNDIELDNKTTVHMSNTKMISWHSGSVDVVGRLSEKDSVITVYNSNNEMVFITEYSTDKDVNSYLSYLDFSMKEYNYNGRDIYIVYYNDNAIEKYRGKYYGIMFKIDDIWYEIDGSKAVDLTTDVDAWINGMCNGVVSFK